MEYLATYVDEGFGLHISFIGKPGSSPRHGDNNVDFHPRGHSANLYDCVWNEDRAKIFFMFSLRCGKFDKSQ